MGLSRGAPGEDGISPGHVCGQGLRTAQAPQAAGLHAACPGPLGAQLEPGWHLRVFVRRAPGINYAVHLGLYLHCH